MLVFAAGRLVERGPHAALVERGRVSAALPRACMTQRSQA